MSIECVLSEDPIINKDFEKLERELNFSDDIAKLAKKNLELKPQKSCLR